MGSSSRPSDKPKRIGVFLGNVDDSYQRDIWRNVHLQAEARGVELIGFFGHGLGASLPSQYTMNIAYRLATPECVDGLIVFSNTVGNFMGPDSIARLIAGSRLPAVSIEFALDGVPTVSARSRSAMIDMVLHLARAHGRRRLALVTGPESHPDSIERELAFRDTLASEGIPFDERLLYHGKFLKESGSEAVRAFLDAGLSFDAVVCLNDYMAMGAIEALRERGLAVPGDVVVTGFDDVEEARWMSPPITTVRQPMDSLGRVALDMVLELLDGGAPPSISLECFCVFRRSCGCQPALPLTESGADAVEARSARDIGLVERIGSLASSGASGATLQALSEALAGDPEGPDAIVKWRRFLLALRARTRPAAGEDPADSRQIGCFDQALAFLNEAELRREVGRNIWNVERHNLLRELSTRLLGTFSLDSLVAQWEDCVRLMGFGRAYLVLFKGHVESGGRSVPPVSRLVAAFPVWGPAWGGQSVEFPTQLLLPQELSHRWGPAGWFVEPLVYQDESLGYILVECGSEDSSAYETLRVALSTALKGTLLMDEIRTSERRLERLVEQRTIELRRANDDLRRQIEERRILEREVREISNSTMQAIGQDIHDDLCQHLVGISMLAVVAEEAIETKGAVPASSIREIRLLLEGALERARGLARSLYPTSLKSMGLVSALEDLADTMDRSPDGASISFQAEGDCSLDEPEQALQLYRIAQEALSNALRHSGSGEVVLRVIGEEGRLLVEVRDFGRGLGVAQEGRGMGMRIMRYRADSIGARLEVRSLDPGVCVSCSIGVKGGA